MTFLAPLFAVAGVLLVGIPVAIHLWNRRRYKVVDWAAMQFLLAAMKKNRRRLRFEQWLLLAMRCLVVALMGLALARPMGCDRSALARLAGRSASLHVIILDNSYSMAYEADRPGAKTNLDQAKKIAHALIERLSSGGDSVALITAGRPAAAVLASPTYDLAAAAAAVDRVAQTNGGTDLSGALELAQRVADEHADQSARYLDLFSDATQSAWPADTVAKLAQLGPKLGKSFHLRQFNLAVPNASNVAVTDVAPTSNLVRTRFANDFRATVRDFGGTTESSLLWTLGGDALPGGSAMTLDAQTPPVTQSNAQVLTGGPTVLAVRLSADDRLPVDNARYRTLDVAAEMKVLIVEGRAPDNSGGTGSAQFLSLALAPPALSAEPGRATDSYLKPDVINEVELAGRTLGDYRAVLMTDVAQTSNAAQLAAYVKAGGTLVWFTGEQVSRDNYNNSLVPLGLLPGPLTVRQTGPGFTFAFDPNGANDPLLSAFATIQNSGLNTAQTFTYWQVQPKPELSVRRVLSFQNDAHDPAVTFHTLGDGRVVFFASTADAEWTDFPAKPAYVALMHEILAGSVAGSERWMNLEVGQRVQLPASFPITATPTLRDPATNVDTPLQQTARPDGSSGYDSAPIDKPGVYTLASGSRTVPISVNVPADEADLRPVSEATIRKALGNVDIEFEGADLPAETTRETGRDFGWSVMTCVLALLGGECFLAMRFGHNRR